MRIFTGEPLEVKGGKIQIPLLLEAINDEDIYQDVWLPIGDNKQNDLERLIKTREWDNLS